MEPEFYIEGKPARYARTGDPIDEKLWHDSAYNVKNPHWVKATICKGDTSIGGYEKGHSLEGINPWFAVLLEPEESFTMEDYERELLLEEEGKLS